MNKQQPAFSRNDTIDPQESPNLCTGSSITHNFLPSHAKPSCTCSLGINRGLMGGWGGMWRHRDLRVSFSITPNWDAAELCVHVSTLGEINGEIYSSSLQQSSLSEATGSLLQRSWIARLSSLKLWIALIWRNQSASLHLWQNQQAPAVSWPDKKPQKKTMMKQLPPVHNGCC